MSHQALTDTTRLSRPIYPDGRYGVAMLRSIGEATRFITNLPKHLDGLVFGVAGTMIELAVAEPTSERVESATDAIQLALGSVDLLDPVMHRASPR